MKKSINISIFVFFIFLIFSCNSEQKNYHKAVQANNIEALKEFANNFPDGPYIDSVKLLIDKLLWDSIMKKDIICDYETFINEHPNSKFIDSAKAMIDKQQPVKEFENEVKDKDCNLYKVVKIGNQNWMAENLRTTKYKDGTPIPQISDKETWSKTTTTGYCWYNNNSSEHKNPHGALYNWYALSDKLCPKGWHIPSENEWSEMIKYLGGNQIAGLKMKSTGDTFWKAENGKSTNSSDFSALPSGTRDVQGTFSKFGESGKWWITSDSENSAFAFGLTSNSSNIDKSEQKKNNGFSVRCIEDAE